MDGDAGHESIPVIFSSLSESLCTYTAFYIEAAQDDLGCFLFPHEHSPPSFSYVYPGAAHARAKSKSAI